jgi:hypothetical protein
LKLNWSFNCRLWSRCLIALNYISSLCGTWSNTGCIIIIKKCLIEFFINFDHTLWSLGSTLRHRLLFLEWKTFIKLIQTFYTFIWVIWHTIFYIIRINGILQCRSEINLSLGPYFMLFIGLNICEITIVINIIFFNNITRHSNMLLLLVGVSKFICKLLTFFKYLC